MLRRVTGLVVFLCAAFSLSAQTVTFGARQDIQTGATHLFGLAVADFNGDKKLDIAVTDDYSQTVSVYLNDGTGKFGPPVTSTFTVPSIGGFGAIVAGDVNEDGKQDLLVGPVAGAQLDVVLLGNGDGTFTEKGQITGSYGFEGASLVDINGDKHLDLLSGGNGNQFIALGDGQGNFTQQPLPNAGGDLYTATTVGDFNGDKNLDFVLTGYSGTITFYAGKGDGTFQNPAFFSVPHLSHPGTLASADFNGDGKLDLLIGASDVAFVVAGNGDGTFQTTNAGILPLPAATHTVTNITPLVAAADMDGDGKIDAVAADDGSDSMNVLLGNGSGVFSKLSFSAALDDGSGEIRLGDLNGDGLPDVVLVNYKTQKISYFLSNLKTTPTVSVMSNAMQALVGGPVVITVEVDPSSFHTPTGTITLTSGTTSFGQQMLNAGGRTSFTLPSLAVGQYPLTATYSGDTYNNGATNSGTFAQSVTDFQLTVPSPTQTIRTGTSATYNLTLTPIDGFTSTVAVTCAGLPIGFSCPSQNITVGAQAVNASIVVTPPTTVTASSGSRFLFHTGAVTFLAFSGLCWFSRRRGVRQLALCIVGLVVFGAVSGCNGGGSASTKTSAYTGTNNFTIMAVTTNGSVVLTHQISATLTVQ